MKGKDIMHEAAGERMRGPQTKEERAAVSSKIAKLRREGMDPDQAVATAMSMHHEARLGPRGGYKRGGK